VGLDFDNNTHCNLSVSDRQEGWTLVGACYGLDESKPGILEARNPEIWEFGNLGISRSTTHH